MGSGTTAVACINTNRHYVGFETDPEYYQYALDRCARAKTVKATTLERFLG